MKKDMVFEALKFKKKKKSSFRVKNEVEDMINIPSSKKFKGKYQE